MSDDMGYSDSGAYGGEIRTPAIDRLASEGRQFTQFYNTARCCPTRASLLTGLYPHQAGIGHLIYKTPHPGYGDFLSPDSITIAEVLRDSGYGTYMSGKWHLAPRSYDPEKDVEHWPTRRGFDKFYGTIAGSGSFWDPSTLCRGETFITPENDPKYQPDSFYYTDAITDNALTFLEQHLQERGGDPFFLYLAYTSPHWPLHAPKEEIDRYDGVYDKGYAAIREQRVGRLRELGLLPEVGEVADPVGDWNAVKNKEVEAALMETYAAMITRMDQGIGRIVEFLDGSGQFENTLIFYLQDNGACAEDWFGMETNSERKFEPMGPDDRQTSYRPRQTRDGRPVRRGHDVIPGPADTYSAYKENWANVSNTPFRKFKHYVHEGGISTPLIVHWPENIPSGSSGRLIREPAHLIDIMPTCLEAGGIRPPDMRKGMKIKPFEGVSLMPVLTGSAQLERDRLLFWEHESNRAIRDGKWKLVSLAGEPSWELYDMSQDRGEMNDLSETYPQILTGMAGDWYKWADRTQVLPVGGWMDVGKNLTSLDLKTGDSLLPESSPMLVDRKLILTAKVLDGPVKGTILAQGTALNGYSLYVRNNRLVLAIRSGGVLETLEMDDVPDAPFIVRGSIAANGRSILGIDDRRVDAYLKRDLPARLGEGLSVGFDSGSPVGEYQSGYPFEGRLGYISVRGDLPGGN
jgi:arylsulfatase